MTPQPGQRWRLCRDGIVRDVNDPMTAPQHDDATTWAIEGLPDVVRVFANAAPAMSAQSGTCDVVCRIRGTEGPITLGRCFLAPGHFPLTQHRAPFDRIEWGGTEGDACPT